MQRNITMMLMLSAVSLYAMDDMPPVQRLQTLEERFSRMSRQDDPQILAAKFTSKEFMDDLHASAGAEDPFVGIGSTLQKEIHRHMPQQWAEHLAVGHGATVNSVAFSSDGALLATGSDDKYVPIIRVATGAGLRTILLRTVSHGYLLGLAAFLPNDELLAMGSRADTGAALRTIPHDDWVRAVAFSPNGKWLATGADDKYAGIFKLDTGAALRIKHGDWVRAVAFSPDSALLATGSDDGNVRIINAVTGVVLHKIPHDDWVRSVAFSPNGKWLATGADDKYARIINAATSEVLRTIKHGDLIRSLAFSPNEGLLATGADDTYARIIDAATGEVLRAIKHNHCVYSVAFSPNGASLATGSNNNARIIRAATGEVLHTIPHGNAVVSLAFSPDGTSLSMGSGKYARIYACVTDNLKHALLVAYLKHCEDNNRQPNMRGWLLETFQEHSYRAALVRHFRLLTMPTLLAETEQRP